MTDMFPTHPAGRTCIECRSYFANCSSRGVAANAIRCAFVPAGFDPDPPDDIEADSLVGALSSALVRQLDAARSLAASSDAQAHHAAARKLLGRCQRWIAKTARERLQAGDDHAAKVTARKARGAAKAAAKRASGKPKKKPR